MESALRMFDISLHVQIISIAECFYKKVSNALRMYRDNNREKIYYCPFTM